jgi:dTDP-4-dehydrorhamnose 3,5-epimerase
MKPVVLLTPQRHGDTRGWFSEVFKEEEFGALGANCHFVQDNQSLSRPRFTLRGLHCQMPPFAQAKLVRCIRGSIFDVAVDLRRESPTYGHWTGVQLSAENGRQLFIAVGFAHGFLTLEPETEILYKVSNRYSPAHDTGIRWDDKTLGVEWPIPCDEKPILSDKDQSLPTLAEFASPFDYDGTPLEPLDIQQS